MWNILGFPPRQPVSSEMKAPLLDWSLDEDGPPSSPPTWMPAPCSRVSYQAKSAVKDLRPQQGTTIPVKPSQQHQQTCTVSPSPPTASFDGPDWSLRSDLNAKGPPATSNQSKRTAPSKRTAERAPDKQACKGKSSTKHSLRIAEAPPRCYVTTPAAEAAGKCSNAAGMLERNARLVPVRQHEFALSGRAGACAETLSRYPKVPASHGLDQCLSQDAQRSSSESSLHQDGSWSQESKQQRLPTGADSLQHSARLTDDGLAKDRMARNTLNGLNDQLGAYAGVPMLSQKATAIRSPDSLEFSPRTPLGLPSFLRRSQPSSSADGWSLDTASTWPGSLPRAYSSRGGFPLASIAEPKAHLPAWQVAAPRTSLHWPETPATAILHPHLDWSLHMDRTTSALQRWRLSLKWLLLWLALSCLTLLHSAALVFALGYSLFATVCAAMFAWSGLIGAAGASRALLGQCLGRYKDSLAALEGCHLKAVELLGFTTACLSGLAACIHLVSIQIVTHDAHVPQCAPTDRACMDNYDTVIVMMVATTVLYLCHGVVSGIVAYCAHESRHLAQLPASVPLSEAAISAAYRESV